MVAEVPLINLVAIVRMRSGLAMGRRSALWLGFALAISFVYWMEFLPWTLFGVLLCWTGFGLLPLAPFVSCIATARVLVLAKKRIAAPTRTRDSVLGVAAG